MLDVHHYNTDNIQGTTKLRAWREYMSEVYYSLDIIPVSEDKVRGELHEVQFASMGLSNFKADAQRVVRHQSAAKHDKAENFVFLFPTKQKMSFEQRGKGGIAHPGNVFLLNSSDGYVIDVPDESENVTLKIPCSVLRPRIRNIDDVCGTKDFANPFLVPVVAHLGMQLLKFVGKGESKQFEQVITDLICLMLNTQAVDDLPMSNRQSLVAVMYDRLISYMRVNFRDPNLSPGSAAAAHRISVRYLHNVFHRHGTTFGDILMEMRLVEASRMLLHIRSLNMNANIGELGYQCGFVSQAHFAARFRQRFGVSPRNFG